MTINEYLKLNKRTITRKDDFLDIGILIRFGSLINTFKKSFIQYNTFVHVINSTSILSQYILLEGSENLIWDETYWVYYQKHLLSKYIEDTYHDDEYFNILDTYSFMNYMRALSDLFEFKPWLSYTLMYQSCHFLSKANIRPLLKEHEKKSKWLLRRHYAAKIISFQHEFFHNVFRHKKRYMESRESIITFI